MQEKARPSGSLPDGRFTAAEEFFALIRETLAAATVQGWRDILKYDTTLAEWPLGERVVA